MFLKTRGQVASQIKSPHARKRFSVVVKTTQQLKREYLIEKVFPGKKWGSNVTRGILNALLTHPSFITNSKSRSRLAPLRRKTNKSALAFPLNGNLNRRFEMDTDQFLF